MRQFFHEPVLLREVLDSMGLHEDYLCLDATTGGAGHESEILKRTGETGFLYGMDRDESVLVLEAAAERLEPMKGRFALRHGNYSDALGRLEPGVWYGVLIHAGVSSPRLNVAERGFGFMLDGILDMRMDRTSELTAAQIVNEWPEDDLAGIFFHLGQETRSRFIARKLVEERRGMKFRTTLELASFIEKICPRRGSRIHSATLVFQALRMEVNQEIPSLVKGRFVLRHGNYSDMRSCLKLRGWGGALIDAGAISPQVDTAGRSPSLKPDAPHRSRVERACSSTPVRILSNWMHARRTCKERVLAWPPPADPVDNSHLATCCQMAGLLGSAKPPEAIAKPNSHGKTGKLRIRNYRWEHEQRKHYNFSVHNNIKKCYRVNPARGLGHLHVVQEGEMPGLVRYIVNLTRPTTAGRFPARGRAESPHPPKPVPDVELGLAGGEKSNRQPRNRAIRSEGRMRTGK